jgi:hypothetical protein
MSWAAQSFRDPQLPPEIELLHRSRKQASRHLFFVIFVGQRIRRPLSDEETELYSPETCPSPSRP